MAGTATSPANIAAMMIMMCPMWQATARRLSARTMTAGGGNRLKASVSSGNAIDRSCLRNLLSNCYLPPVDVQEGTSLAGGCCSAGYSGHRRLLAASYDQLPRKSFRAGSALPTQPRRSGFRTRASARVRAPASAWPRPHPASGPGASCRLSGRLCNYLWL
jgi:hypothetical protein